MEKGYTFIFFGAVGSGKGTQAKLLADYLKANTEGEVIYSYPGDKYRNITSSNSQTGEIVNKTLSLGGLQPDFLTNSIFLQTLVDDIRPGKHLIADGYPRTINQASYFNEVMKYYDREEVYVIYLELSREEAEKRLKLRGRHDDTDFAITTRFDEYVANVLPAMESLRGLDGYKFVEINGAQSIEDVHKDIISAINI